MRINREKSHPALKALPLTLLASALSTAIYAEEYEEEDYSGLNVVVVTAQKRPESTQDIPISLSVISADQMQADGIEKIEDLQYKVPNLQMSETGVSTQMYIRGIGTGSNQGFEQSVGQYIDGIYYGRQQLIRAPFLDLERVEVLRGPQSILFGKNSIAGALNMTSAKPSHELETRLGLQYVPDFGSMEITGMVSGAVTEDVSARLAIRKLSEDGYMKNTTANKNRDEVERDDLSIRASFLWTPSDEAEINLKIERNTFDSIGRQIEIIRDDPFVNPVNLQTTFTSFGMPNAIEESNLDYSRQANDVESSNNTLNNATLTGDFEFGEYTLTSVTGLVSYEFKELCDCDFIAVPVFDIDVFEEYDQFSQELRVLSPLGDSFDWVGGVFYQSNELYTDTDIAIPETTVLALLNPAFVPLKGTAASRNYKTETDLWAVFFQGNWHLNDSWELTVGARYTSEEKTASRTMNIIDISTDEIATDPAAPFVYLQAFGIQNEQVPGGHNLEGKRDESSFTPLVSVQYKASDTMMFYASAVTGFKGGGFDAQANNVGSWEFEEEEATSFELGLKSTFFDNTLEANIAIYRTDYDNLQVGQFDGVLGFTVGNAKETQIQGIEVDGRWLMMDSLTMNYALGYLDHEFIDFKNGNCHSFQVPDGDIGPDGNRLCDYSGKSGQYTPSFTSSINLQYDQAIDWFIFDDFVASLGMYYSSSQNVDVNLNPLYEVDGYTKFDFRVALEGENYSVAFFGKNITDEKVLTYVGNVPLSINTFGTNTFYGFVDRPSSYGLQFTYEY